jgi:hypothetical protein
MNSSLSGFSDGFRRVVLKPDIGSLTDMFVFDRSALPVLLPLALLVAVVLWSNRGEPAPASARQAPAAEGSTVAQVDREQDKSGG